MNFKKILSTYELVICNKSDTISVGKVMLRTSFSGFLYSSEYR